MIDRRLFIGSVAAATALGTVPAGAEEPLRFDLWRLVAAARLIVIGSPMPDPAALDSINRAYVTVPVEDVAVLKGQAPSPLVVNHWNEDVPYSPSNEAVLAVSGRPAVLFLISADTGSGEQFYFVQNKASLRPADGAFAAATRTEIAWQREYLRHWKPDIRAPHYGTVKAIIGEIAAIGPSRVNEESALRRQQSAFGRLEALGADAVPAIIAQMDDRRPLAIPQISLVNHAVDAFEGMRHYGPKLMVDALSAILNQITGESFSGIQNGGSEEDRVHDVNGWRIYLGRDLPRT